VKNLSIKKQSALIATGSIAAQALLKFFAAIGTGTNRRAMAAAEVEHSPPFLRGKFPRREICSPIAGAVGADRRT